MHHLSLPKASHVTQPACQVSPCWILSKVFPLPFMYLLMSLIILLYSIKCLPGKISASQRVLTLSLFNNDPPDL